MVLAAAGGVQHESLVKLAEQYFGDLSMNYDAEIPILPPCRFTGSEVSIFETVDHGIYL
jgi:processing peptidase subunit beta